MKMAGRPRVRGELSQLADFCVLQATAQPPESRLYRARGRRSCVSLGARSGRMVNPRYWACTGLAALVIFLVLLAALHFLEPEFDPSKCVLSEYELGRYGWVMSLAFFSLGIAVLAMLRSTRKISTGRRGRIGRWWFLAISIAFFGAGIFCPYTPLNFASYIHGLCGV